VHIGLQGKKIPTENLPPSNLVFLIDVSGSMSDPNKLPLLKSSFKMLTEQLRAQDQVAIVVYAGAAGVVLPSTSGADKKTIVHALDELEAGGSTAGGAGIKLAYAIAKQSFRKDGNNRVIIATDGDFNVGESSNASMERLVEEKRNDGIFLTVLGFGMGNYKDSKMETLADKGNGNYAYIDNILEAQKVLVNEFGGTLFTIAKDVKLQIEFNPAKVKAYRLIGYENRVLKNEDFNNDKKDAGELGSGHTVTALYEVIPVGVESEFFKIDELKYQSAKIDPAASKSKELMTVKFRYKKPNEDVSKLIVHPLVDENIKLENTSANFRWSAAVAGFGMLLRDSEYVKGFSFDQVLQLAQGARGKDQEGYRIEFINLVKSRGLTASR
jgi:Ca-activated chloride channel family protein